MKKLKTAVVGVGYLGKFHAEKYAQLPHSDLVAVCDADAAQAEAIATLYQVTPTTDYQSLVGQVEAVSIAAPTHLHHELALFFLQHGIHVLVEKPIATDSRQAAELVKTAQENKLILQVGHIERFNPCFKALQTQLEHPRFIEAIRLAPFKTRGTDVDVILDVMIHDLDLIHALVQKPIRHISAAGTSLITSSIDAAEVSLEFENDLIATLKASRVHDKIQREFNVYQEKNYLSLDLQSKTLSRYSKSNSDPLALTVEKHSIENRDALKDQIEAFINAVLGLGPILASGAEGQQALETALRISALIHKSRS